MAALTSIFGMATALYAAWPPAPPGSFLRGGDLLIAAVYFLLPLYAALRFAGLKAFGTVFTQAGFGSSLWLSQGWRW